MPRCSRAARASSPAGRSETVGGQSRNGAAELAAASGAVSGWAPRPDISVAEDDSGNGVTALAATAGQVLIGGDFTTAGGVARHGLAEIDPKTGKPTGWAPVVNGNVMAFAADATRVFLIGSFTRFGGTARNGQAALDTRLRLLPYNPPPVHSLGSAHYVTLIDDRVVVTGGFDGVVRGRRPRLDGRLRQPHRQAARLGPGATRRRRRRPDRLRQ